MNKISRAGAVLSLLLAASCTDREESPVVPDPAQGLSSRAGAVRLHSAKIRRSNGDTFTVVRVNRGRATKSYRLKVGGSSRTMELTTMTECGPYDDFCTSYVDEPLDAGILRIGDQSMADSGAECPSIIGGGSYIKWRNHDFIIWGDWIRQKVIRSWPWGEAEYAIPMGPHQSRDGKATIYNGVAKGSCYGYYSLYTREFNGIIRMTWLRGEATEHASTENGYGGGSFTADDGFRSGTYRDGVSTGDSEADQVLNDFLTTGECTPGWVIIVDGVRVC